MNILAKINAVADGVLQLCARVLGITFIIEVMYKLIEQWKET